METIEDRYDPKGVWNTNTNFLPHCLLCNKENESIGHLFFNYEYTRDILIMSTEFLNNTVWKVSNSSHP